jgi:hypothetical protein
MFPRHHCYAKNYSICGKKNPLPFPCQERPRRRCEQCPFIDINVHQFVCNSSHEDSTLPPSPSLISMPLVFLVSDLVTNLITSKTLNYNTMNIQKVLCFPTKFDGDILFELPPKWPNVTTPLLEECEDDIHTPKMGTWESSRTPKISEFDCRGQNTSLWSVLQVVGNLLKCRCRKWPRMNHLDICSTSYGKKKGWESN